MSDTQVFMSTGQGKDSKSARHAVGASAALKRSVARIREIAIKHGPGKFPLPDPSRTFSDRQIRLAGVTLLPPIHDLYTLQAAALPGTHKDPFDRLIAAQSIK